jgi:hypothetical protein
VADFYDAPRSQFPGRCLAVLIALWLLMDGCMLLIGMGAIVSPYWLTVWLLVARIAAFPAKFLLVLGWLILGDGRGVRRLWSVLLLLPTLALSQPDPCGMVAKAFSAMILAALFCPPYLMLRARDYRLQRNAAPIPPPRKHKQFSVAQLMQVTLVVAVVLGLLRLTPRHGSAGFDIAVLFFVLLIGWGASLALTVGLLSTRWFPYLLYAVGTVAYLLALPWVAFRDSGPVMDYFLCMLLFLAFFAGHVLLLRALGYRLAPYAELISCDSGILFVERRPEPGIIFLPEQSDAIDRDSGG